MKQSKKQPERTRQAMMAAAGAEFALRGYAGSGLGAIVARAEMTKGALFHHFSDKRKLAEAWIREALTMAIGEIWIQPLERIDSLQAMQGFFRVRCQHLQPGDATSALAALTAELAATDPTLGLALEEIFATWRRSLGELLERGQSEGWIHRGIQPPVESAFLVSVCVGFSVTTHGHLDGQSRRACATAVEGYLETLRAQ